MRLSELVSGFGLWIYPTVGLLGFVGSFVIVTARAFKSKNSEMAACGALPLDDGTEGSEA